MKELNNLSDSILQMWKISIQGINKRVTLHTAYQTTLGMLNSLFANGHLKWERYNHLQNTINADYENSWNKLTGGKEKMKTPYETLSKAIDTLIEEHGNQVSLQFRLINNYRIKLDRDFEAFKTHGFITEEEYQALRKKLYTEIEVLYNKSE